MGTIKVGILGAGTIGKQLALLFAANDMSVSIWNHRLQPNFQADLSRLALIQSKLGNITKDKISEINERINYSNDLATLAECELIVETVKEDKEVKIGTIKQLLNLIHDFKVIATNTSTLSITELASFTDCPSQFLGLHFFNPPMSMRLVEVIKGELTSDETLFSALRILELIGKQPVVLPETPGFVVNRLLFPMINEAIFLLSEGVSDAKTIDSCMRLGANHPMGPLELADLIGLDICLSILETLMEETADGKYRPAPLLKKYVRAAKLGKKSGVGFYTYRTKS
jgi:3-hydroxybutyryl-CoA dehydrogenase